MSIEHKDITDPYVHEPKGASTASNHTVYKSNGAGSGSWGTLDHNSLDIADIESSLQTDLDSGDLAINGHFYLTAQLADISTASSVLVAIKDNCVLVSAEFVLTAAITGADAVMNIKNAAGTNMGSNVTVANTSSAKGDKYAWTATGNNTLTGPTWIEITTDGASTNAAPVAIILKFTQQLNP